MNCGLIAPKPRKKQPRQPLKHAPLSLAATITSPIPAPISIMLTSRQSSLSPAPMGKAQTEKVRMGKAAAIDKQIMGKTAMLRRAAVRRATVRDRTLSIPLPKLPLPTIPPRQTIGQSHAGMNETMATAPEPANLVLTRKLKSALAIKPITRRRRLLPSHRQVRPTNPLSLLHPLHHRPLHHRSLPSLSIPVQSQLLPGDRPFQT